MVKILVLVNEDFESMLLGKNTTLAYILAAVDLGYDVFVYKISVDGESLDSRTIIKSLQLNKDNAAQLVKKYKEENQKIVDGLLGLQMQGFTDVLVGEFLMEQK